MSKRTVSKWILAALSATLVLSGCSKNSPLAPATDQLDQNAQINQVEPSGMNFADNNVGASSVIIEVDEFITAIYGGNIEVVSSGFTHNFAIEANGVSEDVNITIKYTIEEIDNNEMAVFEFGPSGLEFNEAADLEYEISELNISAEEGDLYYFNPSTNDWEYQGSVDVVSGKVNFAISHFSKYAISD